MGNLIFSKEEIVETILFEISYNNSSTIKNISINENIKGVRFYDLDVEINSSFSLRL
jgi:hypothetical protein